MIHQIKNKEETLIIRNDDGIFEAPSSKLLFCIITKINELVDHVNKMDLAMQRKNEENEIYERKLLAFSKTLNEMTKKVFPNIAISTSDFLANGKEKEPPFGEWVSVIEKQPTKSGTYLFSIGGELCVCFYKTGTKEISAPSGFTFTVSDAKLLKMSVYWMPLPEPPKEGVHL